MYRYILQKIKSKEGSKLIENFLSLSLLQVFNFAIPLILLPYISNVLGVGMVGKIAFASVVISYGVTIVDYGFNYSAVKDTSRNRHDKAYLNQLYSNVIYSKILLTFCVSALFLILVNTCSYLQDYYWILFCSFLSVPAQILSSDWFFQGIEKMRIIAVLTFFSRLVFLILVLMFIKTEADYILYPLFLSLSAYLTGVISHMIIRGKFGVRFVKVRIRKILEYVSSGFPLFTTLLVPNLYASVPTIYLNTVGGNIASGLYEGGNRFVGVAQRVPDILSRVFYPFLARRAEKHIFYRKVNFCVNFLMALALFFLADFIVGWLLPLSFSDSALIIKIMSITPVFLGIVNVYGINYLVLQGAESLYSKVILYCSIVGLVLGIFLVYHFSYIGLAMSITGSRGILALGVYIAYLSFRKTGPSKN